MNTIYKGFISLKFFHQHFLVSRIRSCTSLKIYFETSNQDGGVGKHALTPHITTAKITTRLQNKYHPDSSENRAIWKSDNQGFKEAMFIQMGRRGRDVETRGKEWTCVERHGDAEQGVPHPHVVDKNQEGHLWSEGSQPHTRPPAQGSSAKKVSSYNLWL